MPEEVGHLLAVFALLLQHWRYHLNIPLCKVYLLLFVIIDPLDAYQKVILLFYRLLLEYLAESIRDNTRNFILYLCQLT